MLVWSLLTAVTLTAAEEGLPLPNWEQEEVQIFPLGGGLWPAGSAMPSQSDGAASGEDDVRLFIPNTATRKDGADDPGGRPLTADKDMIEVGADFFQQHEGMVQGGFVYDPEMLLNEGARDELSRLLANQAEKAKVAAHFVILESRQRLPQTVDLTKLAGANLMGGLSCMVVYPMGEPWRVRLFMSRRVTDVVKPDYLRVMARACIQDALKAVDAWDQLERFAIQLSIRLTWLEREHALPEIELVTMTEAVGEVSEMPEVKVTAPEGGDGSDAKSSWEIWWAWLKPWLLMALGGLVALMLLIFGVRWCWRRWVPRQRVVVWMLPEVQVPPRLGGKHCGGGGASVRY
ncbi:hypothetical protein FEM03_19430 [Phragmitibacter flavus]|uniref:Uncharacterized protein n=1 Tax=Phragmitibacter flavus TaxID=2576071 RepID=A0A5R8K9M2_9BACT|nr:hypothetical protein FEM03_19430 [Phragmitibacter flavus]